MNIRTELTEQHTANLTVEIDAAMLDSAKRKAALKLSRQVNVPGFRKGKAPYHVMVRMVGEGAILEEAIEILSNDIYKDVLAESGVKPYGPGEIADVKLEDPLKIIFSVPLVPEVVLNDYRSVRLDYAPPVIEDAAVDRALGLLREQNAVVEPSTQPAVLGDRVTVDINAVILGSDADTPAEEAEDTAEHEAVDADDDADDDHEHSGDGPDLHELARDMKGEDFMHEHGLEITLDADHEPVLGFAEQLVGAVPGDVRRFTLKIAENEEDYPDLLGRDIDFLVIVRKVEKQTLPALNDDFAARLTADEEKPLTLLELRMRVRQNLEEQARKRYDSEYTSDALDKMVEQASIKYPPVMLEEEIDRFLQDFDSDLRQNGLSLEAYMTIYKRSKEDVREQSREMAQRSLRRSLVMGELLMAEGIRVSQEEVDNRVQEIVSSLGVQWEDFRNLFKADSFVDRVINDLINARVRERIAAIARGEAPEITPLMDITAAVEDTSADDEAEDDVNGMVEVLSTAAEAQPDAGVETFSEDDKGESAS